MGQAKNHLLWKGGMLSADLYLTSSLWLPLFTLFSFLKD